MTRVIPFKAAANETVSHPIILSRQRAALPYRQNEREILHSQQHTKKDFSPELELRTTSHG